MDVAVTGAEAAESFVSQHVDCFVVGDTEGFVAVGIGDPVAEGSVQFGAKGFGGAFWVDFLGHHPSPFSMFFLIFANGAVWSP